MSLKQQILYAEQRVREAEDELQRRKDQVRILSAKRVDCKHEFDAPMKGYEHEGGYCIQCGINELYARTLARQKTQLTT